MNRMNPRRVLAGSRVSFLGVGVILALALAAPAPAAPGDAPNLSTAIAEVAKQNIPAVVHIEVTQRQELANPLLPFENDPFFRYFFSLPRMPRKFKRELKGLGTGMIMDEQGHILTNNHVVGGATEINVLLADGKTYPAKPVGADSKTDLAVIRITAKDPFPHVTFGDSDAVDVGEWVVAIGHPRGLDQTVTQGIISAKHRQGITDPSGYQDFLQTDAAINPGNSGGPLLNLRGEVIGVNAAIVSESGGFEGIGFAIPSNMALHIAKMLIARGKVERGWLGVSIQDLTPELAKSFGLDAPKGALVAEVAKGGPGEKAGLKRGDVILSYQGKDVRNASALRNEVANTPVGKEVKLIVWRDVKKKELAVAIGNAENISKMLAASVNRRLGGEVRAVAPQEMQELGLEPDEGVAIASVDRKGPLSEVGFEPGDIILEVDGQPVEGVESFLEIVNSLQPGQEVTMLAIDRRSGQSGYLQVVVR
ncbi:MAG TPA: Do family serine endopeptidase [Syntrophobacteria bacterium]|nr:Do family serine endopeptidase [Syntrophobacteria bacterium]